MRTNYRKEFFCIWCSVTLALMAFNTTLAENWPCFRGPTRQGISNEKDIPLEWSQMSNIVCKRPIPGEGWSSPIVFDEHVFVTTATDGGASFRLLCLDRLTGTVLWNKQVLRQNPGHKQNFNSYASPTPVTDGRRVYVLAFDGTLAAVSMEGSVIWTHREFEYYSEHGLGVSPILYKDLLIVPFDGSSSGPDRKLGWQKPWDQAVILALDKDTGEVLWRGRRGSSRIAHITPQVLSENGPLVFCRRQERGLFLVTETGVAKCLRAETGEVLWRERLEGRYSASPVWADGRIYFLSEKGKTTVVRAGDEFTVLAENELNEKCGASPAVSQKHIFIRSENNLYCIGRGR